MKALIQRVSRAQITVGGERTGHIAAGLLIFLCVEHGDTPGIAKALASKIAHLRIFEDDTGKMNRSMLELEADGPRALVISQFTLAADVRKGRRPSFTSAAPPVLAIPLIEHFRTELAACGVDSQTGIFGEHMEVELVNDGPVTIWLDSANLSLGTGEPS